MNPYPFIYLKPESGTPFGWSLSVWATLGIACEQAFGRFFPQTESLFTGYFREYAPGLGMVLYLHVNAFFYPPIHCGTKSFFILLKHYFALATSRTCCHVHFSPSGRKEATHGTMPTLIGGRYPKSSISFNV